VKPLDFGDSSMNSDNLRPRIRFSIDGGKRPYMRPDSDSDPSAEVVFGAACVGTTKLTVHLIAVDDSVTE